MSRTFPLRVNEMLLAAAVAAPAVAGCSGDCVVVVVVTLVAAVAPCAGATATVLW